MHDDDGDRLWRVGDLARAAGLSIRALHHYEQVGLMSTHGRTAGGHRLYDAQDVRRLYRIRALRELGLSLTEVAASLEGSVSLDAVLNTHLQHVEEKLAQLTALRSWLAAAYRRHGKATDPAAVLIMGLEAQLVNWAPGHDIPAPLHQRIADLIADNAHAAGDVSRSGAR